ncbi:class I SAM-dependent methyltransferase [Haloimpatiens massiliensis]|uniref:class I SAM-dependent methyltransferase n=1 Tax=Haloimpatiens massiliensis TaxID=1658110 RepID=UPI000C83E05D|nr:class I SAM-dependent methyltransferase [Haloimpatiens massiliensis]
MDNGIFEEMWKGSFSEDLSEIQNFWDLRAEDFNENSTKKETQMRKLDLIEFLFSKGALNKENNILDIGCGPGKYSMEFAKIAESVMGVDISPKMIEYAEKNVKSQGLNNVSFKLIPWQNLNIEELGWNKKFDLSFASMSPAINSKETLLKMIETSKNYCFISGFVHRNNNIYDELSKKLFGQEQKNKKKVGNSIYCAFNILWNLGFHPEITYKDVVWRKECTVEKATESYILQFSKQGSDDKHLKEKIKDYLETISKNDKIKETTKAKIAWMFWKVS